MLTLVCRLWDYCMHEKERKKQIQKQRHGKVQKDEMKSMSRNHITTVSQSVWYLTQKEMRWCLMDKNHTSWTWNEVMRVKQSRSVVLMWVKFVHLMSRNTRCCLSCTVYNMLSNSVILTSVLINNLWRLRVLQVVQTFELLTTILFLFCVSNMSD